MDGGKSAKMRLVVYAFFCLRKGNAQDWVQEGHFANPG
jgi:hypothetical protein